MTKIVSWNVNSVKARLETVLDWVKENQPDILLLQETKTQNESFPKEPLEDLGYNIALSGQKTYNGVAILAKRPIEDVQCGLPGDSEDLAARYIEAVVGDIRVASVYVPNGGDLQSDKFQYKMRFLDRLHAHAKNLLGYGEKLVLGGDFNVAPQDIDVHDPDQWRGHLLCSDGERDKIFALFHTGLSDATRLLHPTAEGLYSWWDYRAGSWQKNNGLRIDLFLISPQAADGLQSAGVDRDVRGLPKASDHAPIWCVIR